MDQHFSRQRKDSRPSRPSASGNDGAPKGRRDAPHARGEERAGRDASPARRKDARSDARPPRSSGKGAAPGRGRDNAGNADASPPARRSAGRGRGDAAAPQSFSSASGESAARREQRPAGRDGARGTAPRSGGRPAPRGREDSPQRASGGNSGDAQRPQGQGAKAASAKDLYPESEFARREGMLEGMPAVMLVNRSLKGYPFRKEFPWCLRLVVAYRADETSGLPLPKEERVMEAFEQNLFGLLKKSVNGHYVGYTSWRGSREFLFYVDEGSEVEDPLNAFGENRKRELEFALEDDPQWTHAAHYFDYRD